MKRRSFALLALIALAAGRVLAGEDDESRLSLADLAPYRAALEKPEATAGPAVSVTFRDLWDHPERYQGRRVRVEGRVVRRFRQGAFGTFPPLAEVWTVSPAGDPFCLVFPAPAGHHDSGPDAIPGASVRFAGTFLRRLRYQGGDTDRLAPLIVGDRPPSVTTPTLAKTPLDAGPARDHNLAWVEWTFGLFAASFIALALARRHLHGPSRRPLRLDRDDGPAPEFVEHA